MSFTPDQQVTYIREGGDGYDFGANYKTAFKGNGQLVFNGRPEAIGQALQLLPGGATWGGGSVPATHLYHSGHASFPYGTLLMQHPGSLIEHILSDVRFTGLTIEGQSGEPWKFTMPFTAITVGASAVAFTPTYGLPGTGVDGLFLFNGGSYQLGGAANSKITSFKLDWQLGVEELYAQAVTPDDIVVQNRDGSIEIVQRVEDATLWQSIYYAGGVSPTTSVATSSFRAVSAFGAGNTLRQIDVNTSLVAFDSGQFTDLDPDGKTVYITAGGKILKGATHSMVALLANGHASSYGP